tara:strand:- start:12561 stop:12767 length:207 start_codon:yes stop_codon:yes gene_type:complete
MGNCRSVEIDRKISPTKWYIGHKYFYKCPEMQKYYDESRWDFAVAMGTETDPRPAHPSLLLFAEGLGV